MEREFMEFDVVIVGAGPAGLAAMQRLLGHARDRGLITILDGKRNDIASTAAAYADATFTVWGADALTVNPYLGRDAVEQPDQHREGNETGGKEVVRRLAEHGDRPGEEGNQRPPPSPQQDQARGKVFHQGVQ